MTTEAPTGVVPAPTIRKPSAFPNRADRQNRTYNTKAEGWAVSIVTTADDMDASAAATEANATWAEQQATAAEHTREQAVHQTTEIKEAVVAETGAIRDQAVAARDAAAGSVVTAQGLANYVGRWSELSGALAAPASIWHAGHYWGLLDDLADVAAAEPGVSTAWAAVGTQVHRLTYEQRGQLRTLGYPGLAWAMVDGLGLFAFETGSTEPDDDESAFVTAEGTWLLQCPSLDAVAYWLQPWLLNAQERLEDLEVRGTGTSSITSVASGAQVSFTAVVTGAVFGRAVAASPAVALPAQVAVFARVTAADTVTVYINNPSATTATLVAGSWAIAVF